MIHGVEDETGFLEGLFQNLQKILSRIHRKGTQKLTIMVIPHTEKKVLNLRLNLYGITSAAVVILAVTAFSILSLVGKSGEAIEYYDMGLTNSQFNLQSTRIAQEVIPLHETINRYTSTIAELYLKLDGDREDVYGQGGLARNVLEDEIQELSTLVDECRTQGDNCSQEMTDEILRRIIFLSNQDNNSLKRAVEISDKIISELKTREKQNLLKNTPSIWPTRGHIRTPYGWQVDPYRGKKIFRQGLEIGAFPGSEVMATAPGKVTDIFYSNEYGLSVWVQHKFGIRTFYAHLDRVTVSTGDQVEKGQKIGFVGKSGQAPVSMLYYEVQVGTVAYNPHAFMNHLQDPWLTKLSH